LSTLKTPYAKIDVRNVDESQQNAVLGPAADAPQHHYLKAKYNRS
jgi:hypothetical protein